MDNELKAFLEGMEKRLKEYIDERSHGAETRLLRGFADYHSASQARMHKNEADVSNINASTTLQMDAFQTKLVAIEMRVLDLEGRKGHL